MPVTICPYCGRLIDLDMDVEHIEICKQENKENE